jgi:antitoxin VapB
VSEPQLSVRSAKAKTLAHALSARTGLPINKVVEQALDRYDSELRRSKSAHPIDAVWALAAEGRRNVPAGTTSNHDEFYDEHGLPK